MYRKMGAFFIRFVGFNSTLVCSVNWNQSSVVIYLNVRHYKSNHICSYNNLGLSFILVPSGPYPTTTLDLTSVVHINTTTPVVTNTLVDPPEAFKSVVNKIIESIPFLADPVPYKPETVLLHMEELRQEINYAAVNFQASVPH